MRNFLYSWIASLFIILILDLIWFSITVERFYKPYMGHILSGNFNYLVAVCFYVLYAFGISYLIIMPGLNLSQSIFQITANGFILGLIAYGAYDLTNQATLKDWPVIVTFVDMVWGATMTSLASTVAYKILTVILR